LFIDRQASSLLGDEELALGDLLKRKQDLLALEEAKWHLKNREIWLKEGDNSTKCAPKYASHNKILNTIWEINDQHGWSISSFEEIVEAGKC
jgi:hypothetical protein